MPLRLLVRSFHQDLHWFLLKSLLIKTQTRLLYCVLEFHLFLLLFSDKEIIELFFEDFELLSRKWGPKSTIANHTFRLTVRVGLLLYLSRPFIDFFALNVKEAAISFCHLSLDTEVKLLHLLFLVFGLFVENKIEKFSVYVLQL